jgi:hypothetical protein
MEDSTRHDGVGMTKGKGLDKVSHVNFDALKLRAGTRLQLRSLDDTAYNCEVEFAAALHKVSIFVGLPNGLAGQRGLHTGDRYMVRGFNGTSEFAFTSRVLQVQVLPFPHAHMAYPDSVEVRTVRDAPRVQASIPVLAMTDGVSKQILGTVKNLSIAGAMVESAQSLGVAGGKINIALSTQFEARNVNLKISAVIRHANKLDEEGVFRSGLEFGNLTQNDKLILYYLLFILSKNE